jgi:hypothetical protein
MKVYVKWLLAAGLGLTSLVGCKKDLNPVGKDFNEALPGSNGFPTIEKLVQQASSAPSAAPSGSAFSGPPGLGLIYYYNSYDSYAPREVCTTWKTTACNLPNYWSGYKRDVKFIGFKTVNKDNANDVFKDAIVDLYIKNSYGVKQYSTSLKVQDDAVSTWPGYAYSSGLIYARGKQFRACSRRMGLVNGATCNPVVVLGVCLSCCTGSDIFEYEANSCISGNIDTKTRADLFTIPMKAVPADVKELQAVPVTTVITEGTYCPPSRLLLTPAKEQQLIKYFPLASLTIGICRKLTTRVLGQVQVTPASSIDFTTLNATVTYDKDSATDQAITATAKVTADGKFTTDMVTRVKGTNGEVCIEGPEIETVCKSFTVNTTNISEVDVGTINVFASRLIKNEFAFTGENTATPKVSGYVFDPDDTADSVVTITNGTVTLSTTANKNNQDGCAAGKCNSGFEIDLSGFGQGTHTLILSSKNKSADPSSNREDIELETIDFAIGATTPSRPKITAPSANETVSSLTPQFTWDTPAGGIKYELWLIDVGIGNPSIVPATAVQANSYTMTTNLNPGRTYRLWVRALNAANVRSPWSDPVDFTAPGTAAPRPNLVSPVTGSILSSTTGATFEWTFAGSGIYTFYLFDQTDKTLTEQVTVNNSLKYTSPKTLVEGHKYSWWVKGSVWSFESSFYVQGAGMTKISSLTAPAKDAVVTTVSPTFTWTAGLGGIYSIWVDDITSGSVHAFHVDNLRGTSYTHTTPLLNSHRYKVWVKAVNWSVPQEFYVKGLTDMPATPVITVPAANAHFAGDFPTVKWNQSEGTPYIFWITDLTENRALQQIPIGSVLEYKPALAPTSGHKYRVWIRGGGWSRPVDFFVD